MKYKDITGLKYGRLTIIKYKDNLSIDGIDANGNYEPNNRRGSGVL